MKPCHDNYGAAISVGSDPAQSFVLTFTSQLNILTGTFRLVSCSNTFQILLLFVGAGSRPKTLTKTNNEVCQASEPLPLINYGHTNATPIVSTHFNVPGHVLKTWGQFLWNFNDPATTEPDGKRERLTS